MSTLVQSMLLAGLSLPVLSLEKSNYAARESKEEGIRENLLVSATRTRSTTPILNLDRSRSKPFAVLTEIESGSEESRISIGWGKKVEANKNTRKR